jgi:hypothetical protein
MLTECRRRNGSCKFVAQDTIACHKEPWRSGSRHPVSHPHKAYSIVQGFPVFRREVRDDLAGSRCARASLRNLLVSRWLADLARMKYSYLSAGFVEENRNEVR